MVRTQIFQFGLIFRLCMLSLLLPRKCGEYKFRDLRIQRVVTRECRLLNRSGIPRSVPRRWMETSSKKEKVSVFVPHGSEPVSKPFTLAPLRHTPK